MEGTPFALQQVGGEAAMADYSRRPQYDEPLSEEDEAVADSGTELAYRRLAASSGGGVATMHQPGFGGGLGGRGNIAGHPGLCFAPKATPTFDSETSGESTCPPGSGAADVSRTVSAGYGHPMLAPPTPQPAYQIERHDEISKGYSSRSPPEVGFSNRSLDYSESPRFWSPFGNVHVDGGFEETDAPCTIPFPSTFRLERTNFVATPSSPGEALSVESLLDALRAALSGAGVDVLEFKPAHCVLECSFHAGNCFLSLFVRVFRAPGRASGELIDTGIGPDLENTPFLVEVQHREGDRLHFTALFREIMREFKNQEGMNLAGTFRYRQRPYPAMGEGLALEAASMEPSRNSIRLLAEREESLSGLWRTSAEHGAMATDSVESPIPMPAGIAKAQIPLDLDDDTMDDLVMLANMQRGEHLAVQANAATAVAGLTMDPDLLEQLSRDRASRAAKDLAAASARLLVESQHRPARRQAAVVVANLSTIPQLCEALLASDTAASRGPSIQQRGLVESLVHLSMGVAIGSLEAMQPGKNEEEIGTRRECMRALVGLVKCQAARDTPAVKLLLSTEPSGRGANDGILRKRLRECRMILEESRS